MKQSERRYRKVKFVQIASGSSVDDYGNESVYGLTKEGTVYRYSAAFNTWVPLTTFAGKPEDEK